MGDAAHTRQPGKRCPSHLPPIYRAVTYGTRATQKRVNSNDVCYLSAVIAAPVGVALLVTGPRRWLAKV